MSGRITAGGNVGALWYVSPIDFALFTNGKFSADVTALNPLSQADVGYIGAIGAIGRISGILKAEQAIGLLRSGADVIAAETAPSLGGIIEDDPTLLEEYPVPGTPDSIAIDILNLLALDYAAVLTDKAAVIAQMAQMVNDQAIAYTAQGDELDDVRGQVLPLTRMPSSNYKHH